MDKTVKFFVKLGFSHKLLESWISFWPLQNYSHILNMHRLRRCPVRIQSRRIKNVLRSPCAPDSTITDFLTGLAADIFWDFPPPNAVAYEKTSVWIAHLIPLLPGQMKCKWTPPLSRNTSFLPPAFTILRVAIDIDWITKLILKGGQHTRHATTVYCSLPN